MTAPDPKRTVTELKELRALTGDDNGAQRVAFTPTWLKAREWLRQKVAGLPLEIHTDAAGNLWTTLRGESDRALLIGGHMDSVPNGGWLDGSLNVLAAVEILRRINAQYKGKPPVTVRLVDWADEEGARFGKSLFGSSACSGNLNMDEARDLKDKQGVRLPDALKEVGVEFERVKESGKELKNAAAYLELHIEQGGILDKERIDIGVVEGIVGINWWDVTIEGFANHAGTTPMNQRQDALLAAAKFIEAVNRVVTSFPGRQVGTVGRIQALPGAPNVIPGKVILSLELRDLDAAKIQMIYQKIRTEADQIAQASRVKFDFKEINVNIPAPTDPRLRALIDQSAKDLGLTTKQMPSGAGHDAQDMARLASVGMIFIPSIGGISHSPKEFSKPKDIENGANVLLGAVMKLDPRDLTPDLH